VRRAARRARRHARHRGAPTLRSRSWSRTAQIGTADRATGLSHTCRREGATQTDYARESLSANRSRAISAASSGRSPSGAASRTTKSRPASWRWFSRNTSRTIRRMRLRSTARGACRFGTTNASRAQPRLFARTESRSRSVRRPRLSLRAAPTSDPRSRWHRRRRRSAVKRRGARGLSPDGRGSPRDPPACACARESRACACAEPWMVDRCASCEYPVAFQRTRYYNGTLSRCQCSRVAAVDNSGRNG